MTMAHKRDRLSGYRWRKPGGMTHVIDEYEGSEDTGRPLLYSSPMPPDARARLINEIMQDDFESRDFISARAPTKDTDPFLSASQRNVFHCSRKQKPVIPLYPSAMPSLRWCPEVEAFSCQEDGSENKHTCRCDNCTSSSCPSRTTSSSTVKRGRVRDNITRYCDQCTMTLRLTDASCAACKSITYIPDPSDPPCVPPPDKDPGRVCNDEPSPKCTGIKYPPPILKKKEKYDDYYMKKCIPFDQEAMRDTDDVKDRYCEPPWATSYRHYIKTKNKQKCRQYCDNSIGTSDDVSDKHRKILYNEGICDSVIVRNPLCPAGLNSPCDVKRDCSRSSIRNRSRSRCSFDDDGYIPYSHTGHSKYHHDCKKSIEPIYKYGATKTQDGIKLKHCPFWLRKAYCNRTPVIQCNRYIPCCIPRKMLTSEKNIESFIRCNRK